jgi:DNA-binding beta-propeller fold protein YncE
LYRATLVLALVSCGRKQKTLPAEPVSIAVSSAAYVTNNGSDTLSILDRDGDTVVTRSLDVDPAAHEAPHHLAIDGTGHLFVALAYPPADAQATGKHAGHGGSDSVGTLLRLDQRTLASELSRDVDQNPGDVVLTHDAKRVLVTHFDMRRAMQQAKAGSVNRAMYARLVVLDAATLDVLAAREVCVAPHGIAVTRDDATALIACYGSDEIAFVDLRSRELFVTRVPLAEQVGLPGAPRFGPYAVTIAPGGERAIVADLESGDVRLVDVAARQLVPGWTVALGARAMMPAFAQDGAAAFVPLQGPDGLVRLDMASGGVAARVAFSADCKSPHVVRVAVDGRTYVVCEGDHVSSGAVLEVDPATLATKKRWVVGVYPDGLAFGVNDLAR